MSKAIIIGGGPAGMMAAISIKLHHKDIDVILLEKNDELGRKLKLTGGGRCNVTANVNDDIVVKNVVKNGKFLFGSLSNFNTHDIITFFESHGCKLKEEDHGRMFPATNKAVDIVNTIYNVLKQLKIEVIFNASVEKVTDKYVYTNNNNYIYDYLVIATGGITLPNTGSDGKGYELAQTFGHTITKLIPAEVPLVSNDEIIQSKLLQGLSFNDVELSVWHNNKVKKTITHDLLITHFGISGPLALRASFEVLNLLEKGEKDVLVTIDFLPNTTITELLDSKEDLEEDIKAYNIPKRLLKYLTDTCENKKAVIEKLKAFPINIYTTRGFKSAFVTNGGINLKEVNPKTMKSKLNPQISFCGEVLDLNAYTGGFNITTAFTTGYTAGKYIKEIY